MKAQNKFLILLLLPLIFLGACNLEKEVEIILPEYEAQRVLECYLEPGQPFRLLLSNSNSYFDPFPNDNNLLQYLDEILEKDADVRIRYNGEEIILNNDLRVDFNSLKIFNYVSDQIVPFDYDSNFELEIILTDGTTIEAATRILQPVPIDSLSLEINAENMARTLIYIKDDKSEARYYRRMLHFSSLDSLPQQDFITDNSFIDSELLVFGSGFDSELGDTIINTIYTLDESYFDFLTSVQGSIAANGNPFGQPGVIISNLRGSAEAIGIFTGLSYDRIVTIVE